MGAFKKIVPGIAVLESPFGGSWSGITLVRGTSANILIDSGATAAVVDDCLIPALRQEGLELGSLTWLLNTHCHGDHIGGHYRIKELAGVPIATFAGSLDKMRDPLKYNKLIRAAFPAYSPPPAAVLRGVEPDRILEDGEVLAGRLRLLHTPGHDDDTVCWYDEETATLICGDSLQGNGTASQGIGFYQDLPGYRSSLRRLLGMDIRNIIAGHPYVPVGPVAVGQADVRRYLDECLRLTGCYDKIVAEAWQEGERETVAIARRLIRRMNGAEPDFLFLALYTAAEHMRTMH